MSSLKRKLALLLGASMAVAAFAAPSASAVTAVTDLEGNPCSAVQPPVESGGNPLFFLTPKATYQSGGCTVHVEMIGPGARHPLGKISSTTNRCETSFDAHIGPDGWGYTTGFVYNGCDYTTTQCSGGSWIIAPREFNPGTAPGLFKYTNANTDLNMSMCGKVSWFSTVGEYKGLISLDIGAYEGGKQVWTNQQTAEPHGSWYYISNAIWKTSEEGVIITH